MQKKKHSWSLYLPSTSKVQEVNKTLNIQANICCTLKNNLFLAHNKMKQHVEKHQFDHHFEEGDRVFLCLYPYKQTFLKEKNFQKITPKFYGPPPILKQIGQVAYKLALSSHFKIHPIFHVSCLMKVVGPNCGVQTIILELAKRVSFSCSMRQFQTRESVICAITLSIKS